MGWMTQVASIPEAPPLTKGLMLGQTLEGGDEAFFSSPIFCWIQKAKKNHKKKQERRTGMKLALKWEESKSTKKKPLYKYKNLPTNQVCFSYHDKPPAWNEQIKNK